jgi:hypothetical protein
MMTQQVVLTLSMTAAAAQPRLRFIGFDGGVPAAGAAVVGVTEASAALGEQVPVNAQGVLLVEAGGAVAVGAEVETDAAGKAIAQSAGVTCGRALDLAAADGDIIRILRGG